MCFLLGGFQAFADPACSVSGTCSEAPGFWQFLARGSCHRMHLIPRMADSDNGQRERERDKVLHPAMNCSAGQLFTQHLQGFLGGRDDYVCMSSVIPGHI